jgi:hypothetical protein
MSAAIKDLTIWLPLIFVFKAGAIRREMTAEGPKLADDGRQLCNPCTRK